MEQHFTTSSCLHIPFCKAACLIMSIMLSLRQRNRDTENSWQQAVRVKFLLAPKQRLDEQNESTYTDIASETYPFSSQRTTSLANFNRLRSLEEVKLNEVILYMLMFIIDFIINYKKSFNVICIMIYSKYSHVFQSNDRFVLTCYSVVCMLSEKHSIQVFLKLCIWTLGSSNTHFMIKFNHYVSL